MTCTILEIFFLIYLARIFFFTFVSSFCEYESFQSILRLILHFVVIILLLLKWTKSVAGEENSEEYGGRTRRKRRASWREESNFRGAVNWQSDDKWFRSRTHVRTRCVYAGACAISRRSALEGQTYPKAKRPVSPPIEPSYTRK